MYGTIDLKKEMERGLYVSIHCVWKITRRLVSALLFFLFLWGSAIPASERRLTLTPYEKNYLLFGNYSDSPDHETFDPYNPNNKPIDSTEVEFQISVKALLTSFDSTKGELYAAYTQKSFWQAYQNSAYFRETTYQPEVFIRLMKGKLLGSWFLTGTDIGFVHQSNGLGGDRERSWNRVYVRQALQQGAWQLQGQGALRINEGRDYNDNIVDYLGNDQFSVSYTQGQQVFALSSRNALSSGFARGANWLSWSFPLFADWGVNGFLQAFSGYGQTLGSYNHYTNAIGVGVEFAEADW